MFGVEYFVPITGHIAWFADYYDALQFADDFGGYVFSLWGLAYARQ
jgi:hypothetical protein